MNVFFRMEPSLDDGILGMIMAIHTYTVRGDPILTAPGLLKSLSRVDDMLSVSHFWPAQDPMCIGSIQSPGGLLIHEIPCQSSLPV
jgi:hypothetical protein